MFRRTHLSARILQATDNQLTHFVASPQSDGPATALDASLHKMKWQFEDRSTEICRRGNRGK